MSRVASLDEKRTLKLYGPASLEAERKAGAPVARLYPYLRLEGGVVTPDGQGTLLRAYSSGCLVVLTWQKATERYGTGKAYRPMREYRMEDVKPYGGGA